MAALRTCSQLYEDASTILYEENTFRYECHADEEGNLRKITDAFYHKSLVRVKHISVDFIQINNSLTARCVASVLRKLLEIGCSLKTFTLRFFVLSYLRPSHIDDLFPYLRNSDNVRSLDKLDGMTDILKDSKAPRVHQRIVVSVSGIMESDYKAIEGFVNSVPATTGWTAALRDCTTKSYSLAKDEPWYLQHFVNYCRTWYLVPTNSPGNTSH